MSLGWRETLGGQSVGRWFHKQLFDVSNSQGLREQRPPGNETSVCQQGFLGALISRGRSSLRQTRRANACALVLGLSAASQVSMFVFRVILKLR